MSLDQIKIYVFCLLAAILIIYAIYLFGPRYCATCGRKMNRDNHQHEWRCDECNI